MGSELNAKGKARCEVCGKNEDRCFDVHLGGERHVFDSFECVIRGLMPKCSICGCLMASPGIAVESIMVCSYPWANLYRAQAI